MTTVEYHGKMGNHGPLVTVCPVIPVQAKYVRHIIEGGNLVGWADVTFHRCIPDLLQFLQHLTTRNQSPFLASHP